LSDFKFKFVVLSKNVHEPYFYFDFCWYRFWTNYRKPRHIM